MSFEDSMIESGFSDEQDYLDYLLDEYDLQNSNTVSLIEEKDYYYSEEEIEEIKRQEQNIRKVKEQYSQWKEENEHEYLLWCENFPYGCMPSATRLNDWLIWLEERKRAKSYIEEIYKEKEQRRNQVENIFAHDVLDCISDDTYYLAVIGDILKFSHLNNDFYEYVKNNANQLIFDFGFKSWEIWGFDIKCGPYEQYEHWKRCFPNESKKFEETYIEPLRSNLPSYLILEYFRKERTRISDTIQLKYEFREYYEKLTGNYQLKIVDLNTLPECQQIAITQHYIEDNLKEDGFLFNYWLIPRIWYSKYWKGNDKFAESFECAGSKAYNVDKENRKLLWKKWENSNKIRLINEYPIFLLFIEWAKAHITEWHQWAYTNSKTWQYLFNEIKDERYSSNIAYYEDIKKDPLLITKLNEELDYFILQDYLLYETNDFDKFYKPQLK